MEKTQMLEALERAHYEITVVYEDGLERHKLQAAERWTKEALSAIEKLKRICVGIR